MYGTGIGTGAGIAGGGIAAGAYGTGSIALAVIAIMLLVAMGINMLKNTSRTAAHQRP